MKKQTLFGKIIAVALVAVMIMSILPITAAAAPSGYQSGDLLVKMDAFNANTVVSKYEGVTVTNQTSYNANRGADYGEDFTEIIGRGAGTDNSYVGGVVLKTNLPLDATSQYTIVFDVKNTSGSALFFGPAMQAANPIYGTHLLFAKSGNSLTSYNAWNTATMYNESGTGTGGWDGFDMWGKGADVDGFCRMVVTIDNGKLSVKVAGQSFSRWWNMNKVTSSGKTLSDIIAGSNGQLWLATGYANLGENKTAPAKGETIMEIKNVSIYAGAVSGSVGGYGLGDNILAMSSFDQGAVTNNPFYSTTVANIAQSGATAARDTDTTKIKRTSGTEASVGIKTNLPMNNNTAYTIDFKLKPGNLNQNIGLLFGLNTNGSYPFFGPTMVVYPSAGKVSTNCKWQADAYKNENTGTYGAISLGYLPWSTVADENGFVNCTFTFDGRYMSLSIDGVSIGTRYDVAAPKGTDNGQYEDADNFDATTLNLQAGFTSKGASNVSTASGDVILEVKDIAIYSGVRTQVQVRDEDGNVVATETVWTGAKAALPTVETPDVAPEAGNEIVYLMGGKYVQSVAESYKRDTVIVAKEVSAAHTEVIGAQMGVEAANGTNKIRFVGGLYNTDGANVGFELLVTYKDANGALVSDRYRRESNMVYSSINATVDGNIKNYNAEDLGAAYLYALVLDGVPTEGQIDIKIVSFRTVNGARVYGDVATYYVVDGALTTTATPLA